MNEKSKFTKFLAEFKNLFVWSYEDIRGFDPTIIQHSIPIKEGIKLVRKKHTPINSSLEETIQKELEIFLNVGIIFLVKYSEWVSNLFHVQK
jgi:hypothetical protein